MYCTFVSKTTVFETHLLRLVENGLLQCSRYSCIIAVIARQEKGGRVARSTNRSRMPPTLSILHPRRDSPDD
jgi:hypothetical protein